MSFEKKISVLMVLLGLSLTGWGRANPVDRLPQPVDRESFKKYWHGGEGAELNRYRLDQFRYRENHPGYAILVFVTEPFRRGLGVKDEGQPDGDRVPVLKLNFIRKFITGIYDYSMMASVFVPIQYRRFPHALKVSTTSQEWCGHTYTQINRTDAGYRFELHSYFEKEADQRGELKDAWLEDELWVRMRIDPRSLPVGEVAMIPGTMYQRFTHRPIAVTTARAAWVPAPEGFPGKDLMGYRVVYPALGRTLIMVVEWAFPYRIAGWIERQERDGSIQETRAVRTHVIRSRYWEHNRAGDMSLRRKLGLRTEE